VYPYPAGPDSNTAAHGAGRAVRAMMTA
jgi:hypothetical protein